MEMVPSRYPVKPQQAATFSIVRLNGENGPMPSNFSLSGSRKMKSMMPDIENNSVDVAMICSKDRGRNVRVELIFRATRGLTTSTGYVSTVGFSGYVERKKDAQLKM